tara:strand:+ start:610 stop:918 length:309 start_codon:yes stop_codon:yes gene_type:complete
MTFSKSFPKTVAGTTYPVWEEVYLTLEEEKEVEIEKRESDRILMEECVEDAKQIIIKAGMKQFETNVIRLATALFEKRASHVLYYKERKCREKFDAAPTEKK